QRRWCQYRLRTLLGLVTLAAGLLVAWRVCTEPYERQWQAMKRIEQLGGHYRTEKAPSRLDCVTETSFQNITWVNFYDCELSDEALRCLRPITTLQGLILWGTKLNDAGLVHLSGLNQLTWLGLGDTQVTDVGLLHVAVLQNLENLKLSRTRVS